MTYKTENMLMVAQFVSSHKSVVENYNVHFRQHPRLSNIKMQRRIRRGKICKHVKFHTRSNYKALTLDSSYQRNDSRCWVMMKSEKEYMIQFKHLVQFLTFHVLQEYVACMFIHFRLSFKLFSY